MVSIRWNSVSVAGIVSIAAWVERIEELGGWGWEEGGGRGGVRSRSGRELHMACGEHCIPRFSLFNVPSLCSPCPTCPPRCPHHMPQSSDSPDWQGSPVPTPLPAASRPATAPPCCCLEWRFFQVPGSGDHFLAVCGAPSYAPESCPLLFLALPSLLISGLQKQGVSRLAARRGPQPRELGLFF